MGTGEPKDFTASDFCSEEGLSLSRARALGDMVKPRLLAPLSHVAHPIAGMRLRLKNELPTVSVMHAYEVRPRSDHRDADLISDALPFGRLWYGEPNAISNAV